MSWQSPYNDNDNNHNNRRYRNRSRGNINRNERNSENDRDWRRPDPNGNGHGNRCRHKNVHPKTDFQSKKFIFMIGLQDKDEVIIAKSPRCRDLNHSEIVAFDLDTDFSTSFTNVVGLEDELCRQLNVLKQKKCPSRVTIHHGVMHYSQPEGRYPVRLLLKHAEYERLFHDSVKLDIINELPCALELMRFDIKITTPDSGCKLFYQMFVKDGAFIGDISKVDQNMFRFIVPDSPEPGFLIKKSTNVCKFDIINPKSNFTTRLKLDYIDHDDQSLPLLMKMHGSALKDFFGKIKIKAGAEDLELNVLDLAVPDGYDIVYYRRSIRKEFNIQDNHLRISREKVFQNAEHPAMQQVEKDITDVFIWNPALSEMFDDPFWSECSALAIIESELKFQDYIMGLR